MLSAFAATSKAEARRKVRGPETNRGCVTLETGTELVVSLTKRFEENTLNN